MNAHRHGAWLGDSVFGSSRRSCAALKPEARRPDRAPYITGRPVPVSPRRFILGALHHAHCESSERSFKVMGPGPADIDASRRPQLAKLLWFAPRRRRPQADRARDPRALGQQRRPLRRRGGLWRALSRTIARRRSPMPGFDARGAGRRDLAGGRALRRGAGRSRKCCRFPTAPSTGCWSPTRWKRPIGRTRCLKNCGASRRRRDG